MNTVVLLRLDNNPFCLYLLFSGISLLVCNCVSLVTRAASSSSAVKYNQHCTTQTFHLVAC